MAGIVVRRPGVKPTRHEIGDQGFTIGRDKQNSLAIVGDPLVALLHAEIRLEDGQWILARRTVRNSLELNGHSLTAPLTLLSGDRIALGETVLLFEDGAEGGRADYGDGSGSRAAESDGREWLPSGESSAIRDFIEKLRRLAASDATLLLCGETGTGKERAAHAIHRLSARRHGPFAVVNCPALPSSLVESELFGIERGVATGVEARIGLLESAAGGTLFLDEVGDLEPAAQTKLLRFLQERTIDPVGGRREVRVDVRIIAATHHDLEVDVVRGAFRLDLYHRLKVLTLQVPPLRERPEDIEALMDRFLHRSGGPILRVSPEALRLLERYGFPGNVRELQHLVLSFEVFVEDGIILPEHIPDEIRSWTGQGRDSLYQKIVQDGGCFWELVQKPFLTRELSREEVRGFVVQAYAEAGCSYKKLAGLMHIEGDHKRLLDFLRRHKLGIDPATVGPHLHM